MTGDPLTVRAAVPNDAAVIADFNVRLARESEGRELDPAAVERGVRTILADATRGQYWLVEENGTPVGQCMVTTEWSDWTQGRYWWFQSVYVVAEARGRGAFQSLWDHVLGAARAAGDVRALRLYVDAGNAPARAVYERMGMAETGYLVYELELGRGLGAGSGH